MREGTLKYFMEELYKKPYNQIPKKDKEFYAREIFSFGLSKDNLNDDGSDLDQDAQYEIYEEIMKEG